MEGGKTAKSGVLQFLYIETRPIDVEPVKYERLTEFVVRHAVEHVAIGLENP
jgi:hypothetical protein